MKAVLFDLDNTLIDFMTMKRAACDAAVDAMIEAGLDMTKEDALKKIFEIYEHIGIEDRTIFQKLLTKNDELDYRILSYGILAYRQARAAHMKTYPNTHSTLLKLREKGLKLAIVSDAPKFKAWMRLCALKIDMFFDVVVTLDDTNQLKPHNLPFKKALEQLSVEAKDCIMIGDHSDRDILGAKNLGMKTVLAKYGSLFSSDVKADHEINKVEELLDIIK